MVKSSVRVFEECTERIPEFPHDDRLKPVLQLIAKRNAGLVSQDAVMSWKTEIYPPDNCCTLCNTPLPEAERVPGSSGNAFLLTKLKLLPVKAFIKRCRNPSCLARHSYRSWREGQHSLFSVVNPLGIIYVVQ